MGKREPSLHKTWKIVSILALLVGVIASIITIVTWLKVDHIEDLARAARDWEIALVLSEPQPGTEISDFVIRLTGKVDFCVMAAQVESNSRVNLTLKENRVELVTCVKPLSEAKWWWVQTNPVVREDGHFEGSAFIGERMGTSKGVEFQIVVLAVPRGSMCEGDRHINLPFYYAASNVVNVKRGQ